MNERDFYDESAEDDFFREHLNEKGEFPRKRENWLKVAAILDQKHAKKRFWKWFWLVFLLASGNLWQAYRAFMPTQNVLPQSLTRVLRDTIFQHDTVYTYIYSRSSTAMGLGYASILLQKKDYTIHNSDNTQNQKIINQNKSFSSATVENTFNSIRFERPLPVTKQNSVSIQLTELPQNRLNTNDYSDFNSKNKINNDQKDSLNYLMMNRNQAPLLTTLLLESKPLELLSVPKLYSESMSKAIENLDKRVIHPTRKSPIHIKPIGIGIQQGFSKFASMPKHIGFTHWQGLYSDFTFTKNITFRLSMDYTQLSYKIFERPLDGEPFRLPVEPLNIGTDFKLDYIEGEVNTWLTGLGFNYNLPIFQKWHPFFTTGYQFRAILPNKTEFEYKNKWTNDEKSIKILTKGLAYDHWWFAGLGCSLPIYKTWNLQMSAKYIYDDHHGNRPLHYGLMQAGLFYHFF